MKFIKIKKKEIIKEIKYLKSQRGGDSTQFNRNIVKLLILTNKLGSLKNVLKSDSVSSYDGLKAAIDIIKERIKNISKEEDTLKPSNIINLTREIKLIDAALSPDPYTLRAKPKFALIEEKISTKDNIVQAIGDNIERIVDDFNNSMKSIGLINNETELNELIQIVKDKTKLIDKKIKIIEQSVSTINSNTRQIEELYDSEIEKLLIPSGNGEYDPFKTRIVGDNVHKEVNLQPNITEVDEDFDRLFNLPGLKNISTKYSKKFLKINIDKNIINLYNEWVETLENYKNKIKDNLKNNLKNNLENNLENKKLIGGTLNTKMKFKNKLNTNVLIGGDLKDKIKEYSEACLLFQNKIIEIHDNIIYLTLKIKRYNTLCIQLINFQNYITHFVSTKIPQGGYTIIDKLDFGFVYSLNTLFADLKSKMDSHDKTYDINPKLDELDELTLKNKTYSWLFEKHYIMIRILANFFNKLLIKWDDESKKDKTKTWDKLNLINTVYDGRTPIASQIFFLLTVFYPILIEWKRNQRQKVANYIKINKIPDRKETEVFNKGDKLNYLNKESLNDCEKGASLAEQVSRIKFERIFDINNPTQEIPNDMQLIENLKAGENTIIITYGYSGVGKTFTLFGNGTTTPGMVQSILPSIGTGRDSSTIKVKIFEIYGLAVPYSFYWENASTLEHQLFQYIIKDGDDTQIHRVNKINPDYNGNFDEFLNLNINYNVLSLSQIANMSEIITNIDLERRNTGRIKTTRNNPDSSRSIMIYDFKIKPLEREAVHLVIIDLPGKENIYETFCKEDDDSNGIKLKDELLNFKSYKLNTNIGGLPKEKDDNGTQSQSMINTELGSEYKNNPINNDNKNQSYSKRLIKTILFSNPLWASMIPELAEKFDTDDTIWDKTALDPGFMTKLKDQNIIVYTTNGYPGLKGRIITTTDGSNYTIEEKSKFFVEASKFKANTGFKLFNEDEPFSTNQYMKTILLRLRSLHERALYNIVMMIKNKKLKEIGDIIDKMIQTPALTDKNKYLFNSNRERINYGCVGLEAFYINENILGILQILANKVTTDRKQTAYNIVSPQKEIYKELVSTNPNYDYRMAHLENGTKLIINKNISSDEFTSTYHILNELEKKTFIEKVHGKNELTQINLSEDPSIDDNKKQDLFNNKFRFITDEHFDLSDVDALKTNSIPTHYNKPYTTLINNYDYNKAFNLNNPPINSVLKEYLTLMNNIYLFFIVTNSASSKGNNTCDKQMQLLADTKSFMDVVAGVPRVASKV